MNKFYDVLENTVPAPDRVDTFQKKYQLVKDDMKDYLVAITPRSGSSWLTELLTYTKVAGRPEEWFNSSNLSGILENCPCNNIYDYLAFLKASQSTPNRVFGAEASFFQIQLVLEKVTLKELFPSSQFKCIYLSRKNFLRQAISLYKAVETGFFHSFQNDKNEDSPSLKYSSEAIKKWILHVLYQEYYWEILFKENEIIPLRISYEDLVEDHCAVINKMLMYLEISPPISPVTPPNSKNRKISTGINDSFYQQFSSEQSSFLEACAAHRGDKKILSVKAL